MNKVVQLRPRRPEPDLRVLLAKLEERVAILEARLPPPALALPANWITVKEASATARYSEQSIYRFCRLGLIDSMPVGGRVAVNRDTLAARLAARGTITK